jgi:hypothetical protein
MKYLGNSHNWTKRTQVLVHLGFVVKLWEFAESLLKFCGIAFGGIGSILGEINFSKGSSAQLSNEFEVFANYKVYLVKELPAPLLDIIRTNEELLSI